MGTQEYSQNVPVDMWSTGGIFAEMISGRALFRGDSEIDTIFQIFHKFGTPRKCWLSKLPNFKHTFPKWSRRSWHSIRNIAQQIGDPGTSLLDELLRYNPRSRISARRALEY